MDANVVVAAFLRDSTVRWILALSLIDFLVPEHLAEELDRHMPELVARAKLSSSAARELRRILEGYWTVVPSEAIRPRLAEAARAMHSIDPSDTPYVAAALAVPCDGVWSDDPHLQQQDRVRCWTTKELVAELRSEGLRFE